MATRYCGSVKIVCWLRTAPHVLHGEQYECVISKKGEGRLATEYVGLPAYLSKAIDSPEAYDEAARAALAFAVDEGKVDENDIDFDEEGIMIAVSRSLPLSQKRRR